MASSRLEQIPMSGIRRVFDKVADLKAHGEEVVNLAIGELNRDTPQHIKEAAKKALDDGFVRYTPNAGIMPLREALSEHLKADAGMSYSPETEIVITVGATEAISATMVAHLNSGDEVIVPEPVWPYARAAVILAGGVPVALPLSETENYQPNADRLGEVLSARSRMLYLNYPHNPTGADLDSKALDALMEVILETDLIVISDEVYGRLLFPAGRARVSICSFPEIRERSLLIGSVSKTYAMTGWRVGWVAGPKDLIQPILKVHQHTVTSANSFAQYGAIVALSGTQEPVERIVQELMESRTRVLEVVQGLHGMRTVPPKGGFFFYLNISGLGITGDVFAQYLLDRFRVAVVPGSVFGRGQDDYVRLSFAPSLPYVIRGMQSIEEVVYELSRRAEGYPPF